MSSKVSVLSHPLVHCHLSVLRDRQTNSANFRQSVRMLTTLLAFDATADLPTVTIPLETPVTKCEGHAIQSRVGLVPILRAGISMVDPMLDLISSAEVWHLGMYRDEETAQPVHYYSKLAGNSPVDIALILDPMLATGGSACMAIDALKQWGVSDIRMLSIIAAPEGIQRVHQHCPEVAVHSCVVDERLNEKYFIVPGLGDAGDRIFNTCG